MATIRVDIDGGCNGEKYPLLYGELYLEKKFYNGEAVIVLGGFGRAASTENFLIAVAEKVKKPALIFDWQGLGQSEGHFGDVTVRRLYLELERVVETLVGRGFSKFHLVGHSLGACVIALAVREKSINIGKQVLLAPALDQRLLLRYWYDQKNGYNTDYERLRNECGRGIISDWPYESEFLKYCNKSKIIKGIKYEPDYWRMEKNIDYTVFFPLQENCIGNIFSISGSKDEAVPSFAIHIKENRIINGADHYFEGFEDEVADAVSGFIG